MGAIPRLPIQTIFYLFSGVVDTNAYIIGENPNKDVDIQVGTFN